MLTPYHQILGLKEDASNTEVKRAYRYLAKKFHPDINKSEGAEDVFIKITEAYEYLIYDKSQTHSKINKAHYEYKERMYKEWIKNNQAAAYEKGRKYANMGYKEYKQTVADEAPLVYYGFKVMGCMTIGLAMLLILLIIMSINRFYGELFLLLLVPLTAIIMTVGEKYIKIKDLLKYFK